MAQWVLVLEFLLEEVIVVEEDFCSIDALPDM